MFSIPKPEKKTINVFDMDVTLGEIALHQPIIKKTKKIKKHEMTEKQEGRVSGNGKWSEEENELFYKVMTTKLFI